MRIAHHFGISDARLREIGRISILITLSYQAKPAWYDILLTYSILIIITPNLILDKEDVLKRGDDGLMTSCGR